MDELTDFFVSTVKNTEYGPRLELGFLYELPTDEHMRLTVYVYINKNAELRLNCLLRTYCRIDHRFK